MFLSIIVPVYNVKGYLIRCLDSINAQTFTDYEVLVVDDGSTDGSGEIAKNYCKGKEKFNFFYKKNGGLISAWKFGFEKAEGEYIGFIDSDDYIDLSMYDTLCRAAINYKADMVMCNHYYVNELNNKKVLHRNPIRDGLYINNDIELIRRKMLPVLGKDYISPSRVTKIINHDLLRNCLQYTDNRITSGEDVNSMVPCMIQSKRFMYIDRPLYYYVKRDSSISCVFNENILPTYEILIENITKCIQDQSCADRLRNEIDGLYNVYGLTWANYVAGSALSYNDKRKQLNRIINNNKYQSSASNINMKNGKISICYKIMMKSGNIIPFLTAYSLIHRANKI